MMKRGVPTDKGDQWKEIAEKNKQIERLERSLFLVEKEITAEKKLNPTPSTKVDEELVSEQQKEQIINTTWKVSIFKQG